MGEEAEPRKNNDEKPRRSDVPWALIIPALTALFGAALGASVTGISNVYVEGQKSERELKLENEKFEENKKIERQKLDADLVKLALQSSGVNGAETLGFMVQTNLIEDAEIRKGVADFLASKKPVPLLQSEIRNGNLLDFRWSANDTVLRAPHGGPFAVISTDGVVRLDIAGGYISVESGIKSPNAYFSQNGEALFVYNRQKAVICFTLDWRGGQQRIIPIRISPPNGISGIGLSEDGNMIVVTGTDNKQVNYDFSGNEINK
jgi:hypothetical protein